MKVYHYCTSSGRYVIKEFLNGCSSDIREDFFDAVSMLETGTNLAMPLSKNLFNICIGLHELRLKDKRGIFRFFYFIKKSDGIFFLHAFQKKTEELPKKESTLILKRIKEV